MASSEGEMAIRGWVLGLPFLLVGLGFHEAIKQEVFGWLYLGRFEMVQFGLWEAAMNAVGLFLVMLSIRRIPSRAERRFGWVAWLLAWAFAGYQFLDWL